MFGKRSGLVMLVLILSSLVVACGDKDDGKDYLVAKVDGKAEKNSEDWESKKLVQTGDGFWVAIQVKATLHRDRRDEFVESYNKFMYDVSTSQMRNVDELRRSVENAANNFLMIIPYDLEVRLEDIKRQDPEDQSDLP